MQTIFEDNFLPSTSSQEELDGVSPIKDYLRGKTVFVTGGLGFVGKLLIEKLLRCDVKKIFLLAREKKGKSMEERFEKLTKEAIFEELLSQKENLLANVNLIKGDLQEIDVGISHEDQQNLINEVEVVFHAAADVRFDESLREASLINIRGTREIMLLSQRMLRLDVFVYVSTAFCTPGFKVRESFYKTHLGPEFMIKLVENLKPEDCDAFETVARRIILPYPNTYTYSKAHAEQIVRKFGGRLKVAVIRPSIITTTFREPLPGYTDNLYGVNGVVTGAGIGVLRIFHIDNDLKANILPADFVVNAILALAWFTSLQNFSSSVGDGDENFYHDYSNESIKIYHCTVSNNNPITWADVKEKTIACGNKYPSMQALWITRYNTTRYYYVSQFLKIFYHFIPALIVDSFLKLMNKQPMLLKIYRKVNKFSEVLRFFTNNEWDFEDTNMRRLCNAMSSHDKKFFACDAEEIDWWDFLQVFTAGLRRFICNETLDNLDEARKRYRRLTFLHHLLMTFIYAGLAFFSYKVLKFYGFIDHGINLVSLTKSVLIKHDGM